MNGRIVIEVEMVGTPPDEKYRFAIESPEGVALDQVAKVPNVVVRNLRKQAEIKAGPAQ